MVEFNGLLPNRQRKVNLSHPRWDFGYIIDGEKVIDPLLGLGQFTLGFNRQDIIDYVYHGLNDNIFEAAEDLNNIESGDIYLHDIAFQLNKDLFEETGFYNFSCLSGSDANEGAIKLAAAYHNIKGNKKNKIISFDGSYHGSTYLNYSMADNRIFSDPFYNLPKSDFIQRISHKDLTKVNWSEVMCVMIEPSPWAVGFPSIPDIFWNALKVIRDMFDVLIIIDDIYTGGGKNGHWCGWKDLPIVPDIFTQGKAITGGYFPLSLTYYSDKINDVLPENFIWEHGFTHSFSSPGILSCIAYRNVYKKYDYKATNKKAREVLGNAITNQYGNSFFVNNSIGLLVPLNASEEYFEILSKKVRF